MLSDFFITNYIYLHLIMLIFLGLILSNYLNLQLVKLRTRNMPNFFTIFICHNFSFSLSFPICGHWSFSLAEPNLIDIKLVDPELYVRRAGLTSFMVACACERAASLSAKLAARLRLRSASSLAALKRLQRSLSLSRSRSSDGMPAPCCWRRPRVASFSRIRCNQRSKGPCPGSNSSHKTFTIYRGMRVFRKLREAQAIKWQTAISILVTFSSVIHGWKFNRFEKKNIYIFVVEK